MKAIELVKEAYHMADIDAWAEKRGKLIQHWWFIVLLVHGAYCLFIATHICNRWGHNLEDHGYANPDSGAIDLECLRCHKSWYTQLY